MSNTETIKNFPTRAVKAARAELAKSHARLVRAAAKTGQTAPAAPEIVVIAEHVVSICSGCHTVRQAVCVGVCDGIGCSGTYHTRAVVDIQLIADRPCLDGWEFLAVVEPLDGGNLIRQIPGAVVADGELIRWRTCSIACDHCQAKRARNETFIVRKDDGVGTTYKQVGRNCLKAFLGGKSAAAIVCAIGWPDLIRKCGEEDEGSGTDWLYTPAEVLAWAASSVRLTGWISRGTSRAAADAGDYTVKATADHVIRLIGPLPLFRDERARVEAERIKFEPTSADIARANAALTWAQGLAPTSDYEQNLSLVARQEHIDTSHIGILASAISAHARVLGRVLEQSARATSTSMHRGTVGDKLALTLTVERCSSFDTDYGRTHINTMRDTQGNAYIWRTSTVALTAGDRIECMGTVKKHSEFRGEPQTELTRCKVTPIAMSDSADSASPAF